MGCDIHLMVEKKVYHYDDEKKENGKWVNIDKWIENEDAFRFDEKDKMIIPREERFYSGRNYNLFSALAGVRSSSFINTPPTISKPKGVPKDASSFYKREVRKWKGDGHSHSWLTLAELKAFDWSEYGKTCDEFRLETIPALEKCKSHNTTDDEVRIVFFFDN